MLLAHCLVCNDKSHFEVKEGTLKNLERMLKNLISIYLRKLGERDIKISDKMFKIVMAGISNESSNVHLMCGYCPNVDNDSLKRVDDSIHNCLAKICTILKDDRLTIEEKIRLHQESLMLLRGNYPISYIFLERFYFREVHKNK